MKAIAAHALLLFILACLIQRDPVAALPVLYLSTHGNPRNETHPQTHRLYENRVYQKHHLNASTTPSTTPLPTTPTTTLPTTSAQDSLNQDPSPQPQSTPPPQPTPSAPLVGGGQATESNFRLIRSTSGSKVVQEGSRFVVQDPRTVFYTPEDKQVFVHFTVEGPVGQHHFEGVWKKPNGRVSVVSEFDYKAEQSRFAGYFSMMVGENPATGMWTIELNIDGETVGSHSFQIVAAARADMPAAPVRKMMSPAEIYKNAAAASVVIENLNDRGERRSLASGFFLAPDKLVTSFQAIDGSSKIRIVTSDASRVDASEVLTWSRREDWVVLQFSGEKAVTLPAASQPSVVGDRVYVLDVPAEGNRVLVETSLIGKQTIANAGERITIGDTLNRRALGSPLLNEYGEVIGLIGGNLTSSAAFAEDLAFSARSLTGNLRGTLAVPINLIDSPGSNSQMTIAQLARSGHFTPPLAGNEDVLSGALSRDLNRKIDPPQAIQERSEFSRQDARAMLLITWLPKQKRKGRPSLRLYDLDNRMLSESVGKKKISVNPQKLSYTVWEMELASLKTGVYRIDVLLDQDTVWRTFFRMVE